MSFKQPKPPPQVPNVVPDLADATNRLNNQRTRRLAQGGRNATWLASIASASTAATGGGAPPSTLTGLQG